MLKYRFIIAATLAATGFSASAGGGGNVAVSPFTYGQISTTSPARAGHDTQGSNVTVLVGERGIVFADPLPTRTRAEVVAELREATRLGLTGGGEAGPRPATAAEEAQITQAGREAAALVARSKATPPS
jgi:hypothetical protein